METELDGHKTTGTYKAATPPRGRKPVGAKWVFSYKTDKDGIIAKTKARLVAKGSSQMQDVDYFQTFAPTPSSASIKILAAVANEQGLKIFHLDVAQTFVRAKLDAEMYMKLHVRKDCSPQQITIWSKAEWTPVGRTTGRDRGRTRHGAE